MSSTPWLPRLTRHGSRTVVVVALFAVACDDAQAPNAMDATEGTQSNGPGPNGWSAAGTSGRGDVVDLIDPGMNNMAAFSFQKPAGWTVKQSYTREWPSSVPIDVVYLGLTSPDGSEHIEFLPSQSFAWSDGPMSRDLRANAQQFGLPSAPGTLAPMPPLAFLKQHLLQSLARQGLRLRPSGERAHPEERTGQAVATRAYVEGTLENGNQARIEAQIHTMVTQTGAETYTMWSVLPVVVQSRTSVEKTYALMRDVQQSVRWNPAWQEQNHALVRKGSAANSDVSRRDHAARMDAMRYSAELRDQAYRDRGASQDRQHAAFGDTIRGEARFDDPTTGQRVRLQDNSAHVYGDGQGNYLGTDSPSPPPGGNWQETQRVQLPDY